MPTLREWLDRLRGTLLRRRRDADIEAELRAHLEMAAEHARRRGTPSDAPRTAVIRWGTVPQSMEAVRDQRGLPWLDDLIRDLRYALRSMRRMPGFASVAVATLALGIGANTAIFSLAEAALLRPLPVREPEALVVLRQIGPGGDIFPFTAAAAEELARNRQALSGLAAFRPMLDTPVRVDGEPDVAQLQFVSGSYHTVLGTGAVIGRTLSEQDREPVAVISHRYWLRRFGGDPNVVGRVIETQGRAFTIVGVTSPDFFGTQPGRPIDVTAPLGTQSMKPGPNARWLYLIGRTAPGVSREQARAALEVTWTQLEAASPSPRRAPVRLALDPGAQGMNDLRRQFSRPLQILMAAVGVVLLMACANLAGLLLVRASARHQEMAVRLSLGAGRGRLVRQLLTESAVLAAAGGIAGVAFARWAGDLLVTMMSRGRTTIVLDLSPNLRTLTFAALVTLLAAVLFGLLPALGVSRAAVHARLKRRTDDVGGVRGAWGRALVATQVALLVVLLTAAGLFASTLQRLRAVDVGFRADQLLTVRLFTGPGRGGGNARALYDDLLARFSATPGVRSVSLSMDTPLGGEPSMSGGLEVVGRPAPVGEQPAVFYNLVGPRFFETMGIPLLAGRDFAPSDDDRGVRSVVISESVARRYFPGEDPLERQLVFRGAAWTVVGVVKDVRYTTLRGEVPLVAYRPYRQETMATADTFVVRAAVVDPEALRLSLQAQVRAAAPTLPPPSIVAVEDQVAGVLVRERMLGTLSVAFGVLATILAAIGIYGTVAASVARRQREIGIRMALGALPGQIARLVLRETVLTVSIGLAAGVLASIAAGRASRHALAGVLFNLSPTDPVIVVWSSMVILLTASLAAFVPARRASRVDSAAAVKAE